MSRRLWRRHLEAILTSQPPTRRLLYVEYLYGSMARRVLTSLQPGCPMHNKSLAVLQPQVCHYASHTSLHSPPVPSDTVNSASIGDPGVPHRPIKLRAETLDRVIDVARFDRAIAQELFTNFLPLCSYFDEYAEEDDSPAYFSLFFSLASRSIGSKC